jgi:AcrR family transcriptional regulator
MFMYAAGMTAPGASGPASTSVGPQGLRERKKLATRQALGAAAMQLAVERGLENVLVEDIAAAADVSPRTFNNYFASKYEAICALALDRAARVGEALRERPAGESLWAAVRGAVLEVYGVASAAPDPELIAGIRLVTSSPELRGEYLKALSIMQYDLAGVITERSGGDPAADAIVARALAAAVTAVIQAATERWLFADPPVPLAPVVEDALGELVAGLRDVLLPAAAPGGPPAARRAALRAQSENEGLAVDPSG